MPPAHPRGRFAYVSDDVAGQVVAIDVAAARVIGRVEVGEGARHITISPDGTRVVAALGSQGAAARARRCKPATAARGSCGRFRHAISPTTSASRRMASRSGSARVPTGESPCTMRGRCDPCASCRPTTHRSTSPSTTTHSVSTSPVARAARCVPIGSADGKLLRTSRVTRGSYNVCALERPRGHAVARRRQADAARLSRPAQCAPRAARARRLHRRARCRWPASRPSRRGAP